MDINIKFILPAALLILTLAFGFWLSTAGKPYNGILFTVHKLIALGMVIISVWQLYPLVTGANVRALIVALAVLAVASVIALFATGALLSIGTPNATLLLVVHRIALLAVTLAMLAFAFLLNTNLKGA